MRPLTLRNYSLPQVIKILSFLVLAVALLFYLTYQARNLLNGPMVVLTDQLPIVQHERVVTIRGQAKNIVAINLNGRDIFTDTEGNFAEPVVLENGYTIMTIKARDRFSRETALTKEFVYKPLPL